ncbi:MAG: hypothetical protein AAF772_20240, partial [Acidobacteriota bacterium]
RDDASHDDATAAADDGATARVTDDAVASARTGAADKIKNRAIAQRTVEEKRTRCFTIRNLSSTRRDIDATTRHEASERSRQKSVAMYWVQNFLF